MSCTLHRSFLIFHVRNVLFYQWWGGGVERSRALLRVTQLLLLTMNLEAAGCQTREASTLPCCLPTGPAGFRFALMDWFLLSPAFSCPSSLTHCCSSECPLHPLGQNTSLLTPPLNTASLQNSCKVNLTRLWLNFPLQVLSDYHQSQDKAWERDFILKDSTINKQWLTLKAELSWFLMI